MLHSGIGESLQYNNERDKRDGRLENLLVWQPSSTAHIYFFSKVARLILMHPVVYVSLHVGNWQVLQNIVVLVVAAVGLPDI
jgi:hypothetical protein